MPPRLADELAAADPRVRVVHQPNRGYGGALKAGFATARRADRLLRRRPPVRPGGDAAPPGPPGGPIAPGRRGDRLRIKRRDPFQRLVIAKTYNVIVSVLFGLGRDIDCAMKVFRRRVFDGLRLDAESPFLSAELLIKLHARA